jgi:hypothetical protein
MNLDILLLLILLLCFILGVLRGLLRQLVSLSALVIGLGASWGFSAAWGASLSASLNVLLGTALFIVAYLLIAWGGKKLIKTRGMTFSKGLEDRILGGVFSLCKRSAVIIPFIWLVASLENEWIGGHPRAAAFWGGSSFVQLARGHNFIASIRPIRRIRGFCAAVRDPEARKQLRGQPAYERLVSNRRYRALREDPRLEAAVRGNDRIRILRNPRLIDLAADESFWSDVYSVQWEAALEKRVVPPEIPRVEPIPVESSIPYPPPADLSTVHLKRGTVLKGRITGEAPDMIMMDLFLDGGVMKMTVNRDEIERIEGAGHSTPRP